jgi:hypothetical protein
MASPRRGDTVKPVFNWLQMQRWHISESNLPPGSEIRFRQVFDFRSIQASARNVTLHLKPSPEPLRVKVIRFNYSMLL